MPLVSRDQAAVSGRTGRTTQLRTRTLKQQMMQYNCLFSLGVMLMVTCSFSTISLSATPRHIPVAARLKRLQQSNELLKIGDSDEVSGEDMQEWVKMRTPSKHIPAGIGSDAELTCEAVGSPPPTILWLKGDVPIEVQNSPSFSDNLIPEWPSNVGALGKTSSRLVIACVSPADYSTIYTCIASAGPHSSFVASEYSQFSLLSPSGSQELEASADCLKDPGVRGASQPPLITLHNPTVLQLIGRDVLLLCEAQSASRPTYHWLGPNGRPLHGARFKVLKSGSLAISRINWADMGDYTCIAENVFGSDSASTFFYPVLNEDKRD